MNRHQHRRCQWLWSVLRPIRSGAGTAGARLAARLAVIASLLVSSLLPLLSVTPAAAAPAAALGAGQRIPLLGESWYLHGANVPWVHWGCDFGCNANGGVSSASSQTVLADGFSQATAGGMHTIRWWVFPGDPWQIARDGAGRPTGVNPSVYADFDAALRLAETHDLYFDFVLFSSPTSLPAPWLTDPAQRASLAAALAPLFARYGDNPRVLAWEVFNEPEFDIWSGKVAQAPVQATVKAIAESVHANSTAYVTVGSAHLDGLSMWVGQGLDFYQAHWYDYMSSDGWCARCTDYATVQARFGLDGPLVIGEIFAASDTDALQRFEDFYAKGYAGAWPWSLLPNQTADRMTTDLAAAQIFASRHADLGPRAATSPRRQPRRRRSPRALPC
jgi:hypothetical protein